VSHTLHFTFFSLLVGYVRFPENYNATKVMEQETIAMKAAKEFDQAQQQSNNKSSSFWNALTLGSINNKRRREARKRREAYKTQKQPWWKQNVQKQESIPDILDLDDVQIDYYDDPTLLQNRPWQERAVVLCGGVVFNLLLAFTIYFGQISVGPGLPMPVFNAGARISDTPRAQTPAAGLLQRGDVVLAMDEQPVISEWSSTSQVQQGISSFIEAIRATPEGASVKLSVLHPGQTTPVDVWIQPSSIMSGAQTIGVMLIPNFSKTEYVKTTNLLEASRIAADYTVTITQQTAKGLATALGNMFAGKGSSSSVSGPIGLIRTGAQVVSTQDWTAVFMFAAAISINLGVVNALPFPALDGGQLLFVLAEAVTRKKVDQRTQEGLTGAALLLLLVLSASAAVGDITSIFSKG
jgi:membrane-associated protease RseP (regulator of RpoE activity)